MPSAGFLVISLIATMLVIVPSLFFFAHGWRAGKLGRVFALLTLVIIIAFGWAAFTDPEVSNFEENAVILYAIWGITLYLDMAVYASIRGISGILKRRQT